MQAFLTCLESCKGVFLSIRTNLPPICRTGQGEHFILAEKSAGISGGWVGCWKLSNHQVVGNRLNLIHLLHEEGRS